MFLKNKFKIGSFLALLFSVFISVGVYADEIKDYNSNLMELNNDMEKISELEYIPVIMYHHFVTEEIPSGNGATVNINEFEEQLKMFKEKGYETIFFDDLYNLIMEGVKDTAADGVLDNKLFDKKYICISIDDGYRSNYELAYPLLKKYNMKANISVITSRIHKNYIYSSKELPKMKWEDLNEMQESGLVKIYSHSVDHKKSTDISINEHELSAENSEEALNKNLTQRGLKVFTYPEGRYNFLLNTLTRRMGYDLQITTDFGVVTKETSINTIPRITIDSGMSNDAVIEKINAAVKRTYGIEETNN